MADIKVRGKLKSATAENILADSSEIAYSDEKTVKEKIDEVESSLNNSDFITKSNVEEYVQTEIGKIKVDRIYDDLESANTDLPNLKNGQIVTVYIGASSDYSYDYNAYLVVTGTNGKTLKEISGGKNNSTGNLVFNVIEIYIDNEKQDLDSSYLEANIGSEIRFVYEFDSQYYPDSRGTVYYKQGSTTLGTDKVYPNSTSTGKTYSWTYNTENMDAGTYTFTLYGVESTGRQSERSSFKIQVGGLSLTSDFNSESTFEKEKDLSINLTVTSADPEANLTLVGMIDDASVYEKSIKIGTSTITIPGNYITEGVHSLILYLKKSDGKISNELKYNIIIADSGKVYAIVDSDLYSNSEGTRLDILLRTIELGNLNGSYTGVLTIRDSSGEIVQLNNKNETTYSLSYGQNLLYLIGLPYSKDDGEDSDGNHYSSYTGTIVVSSENTTSTPGSATINIRIFQSNYNISMEGESNLICAFKSEGQSNLSSTRDQWEDLSGNNISANFNNFNWNTNGWVDVLQKDGSTKSTALVLNSGAYVELGVCPFENEADNMTISIDFETEDILNADAKVISCLYEYDGTDTTTYYLRDADGDYITFDSSTSGDKNTTNTEGETILENVDSSGNPLNKNNIINYFKYAGGYCWIDGQTYIANGLLNGNGDLPYNVTYSASERTINYNKGDSNSEYNNPNDRETYSAEKPIDYKKCIGTTQESVTKQRGFYIDTQYAVLSNSASSANAEDKFHLNFSESTRTKIDLVISRTEVKGKEVYYFPSMIGYTNGCLSLMQTLADDDAFIQSNPAGRKFKIYLGCKATYDEYGNISISDTGNSKIYSFRIYNRALTPGEILKNYAAEIPVFEDKKNVIDNNGISDPDTLAQLPQICLIGAELNGTSTINQFIMQLSKTESSSVSDLKAMKAPAYITYYDPDKQEWWYVDDEKTDYNIPVRLQFQGTSSMVYPMKNYKFKCYKSLSINGSTVTYGAKKKFDLGNGIEENTFCLKADFMDSSHCNNTGSANFISDYNEVTGLTPASQIDVRLRTTVYGYPVLIYYKDNINEKTQHFIGVGNLNLDKSCNDSFGLKKSVSDTDGIKYDFGQPQYIDDDWSSDILIKSKYKGSSYNLISTGETLSVIHNGNQVSGQLMKDTSGNIVAVKCDSIYYNLLRLQNGTDSMGNPQYKYYLAMENPNDGKIVACLSEKNYLRTVNNDDLTNTQCSEYKANSGASGAGGFGNYSIKSIAADTELRYPDDGDLEDEEYTVYKSTVSSEDALSFTEFRSPYYYHVQRMIKWVSTANEEEFVNNIDKHFNRNYLLDYYLTIMLLGGVDSLGKNLMMATWGPENHLYLTNESVLKQYNDDGSVNDNYDSLAFKYTNDDNNEIVITPTINKVNGKYDFAKNSKGQELFYDEDCYSRYTKSFRDGYSSFVVSTKSGEAIWYPIFYDIDTICGLDNSGQLLYDVDIELGDQLSDGTAVFNTADSKLWSKVKNYLGAEKTVGTSILAQEWARLRSAKGTGDYAKFSTENLVNKFFYTRQISKIPERYYNEDCLIKYIYEGPKAQAGSGSYLYCIHGSRYEQMKRWYSQRIYYLDTLYGLIGTTAASLRFNHSKYDANFGDTDSYYNNYAALASQYPKLYSYNTETGKLMTVDGDEINPIKFTFKTYQPGYVGIKWFNGGLIHMQRVKRNGTSEIIGNVKTSGDAEVFIYGGSNIKDIGDMYEYNVKQVDFPNLSKLNRLVLGANGYTCVINKLDLGTNSYLSDLQLINCTSLSRIDVSSCINLKSLDMTGSSITSVSLASGGALESISYSTAITSINLNNFINLSNIVAPSLNNLTSLVIKNCPKILGTKDSPTAKAWALLQQTNNATSLTTIQLTSYGAVDPKVLSNNSIFFFLDKYYSYSTAKDIQGEIYYSGKTIPTYYTKFAKAYPNLKITYNNIEDASEMFANYKNINLIGTLVVYTGDDIYGNPQYRDVKYWVDESLELQEKWHNQDMYIKYGSDSTYTSSSKYYINNGVYYRLLGIYDDSDLDLVRAEIKEHISNFNKFTNLTGMFRGMTILDYIDDDTFNNVDISNAITTEMFSGCTNLRYFRLPGDTIKNELRTRYIYKDGGAKFDNSDLSSEELNTLIDNGTIISQTYYYDPYNNTETESEASYAKKGMRNIGARMFYNCKKLRAYITKPTDGKITIDPTAFEYVSYDPSSEVQATGITIERPVILFECTELELLATTTEKTSTFESGGDEPIIFDNPSAGDNLYYALNQFGERKLNYSNQFITFSADTWLREVYFDIKKFEINDSTLDENASISYAEDSNGYRILFNVISNNSNYTSFNNEDDIETRNYYLNKLKLKSLTCGSLRNLDSIKYVQIPLQQYDCLDTSITKFEIENSLASVFGEDNFTIDTASKMIPASLMEIYIVNTKIIPNYALKNFSTISIVGISKDIEEIKNEAFAKCSALEYFLWNTKNRDDLSAGDNANLTISKIGERAFENCVSLKRFNIPDSVTELGDSVFKENTSLAQINYSSKLTTIPKETFKNCTALNTIDGGFSRSITSIGDNAFENCRMINLLSTVSNIIFNKDTNENGILGFDYFTNISYIGDYAFTGVSGLHSSIEGNYYTLRIPSTLRYIGIDCFRQDEGRLSKKLQTELKWIGDYKNDFTNLVIGNRAFYNLRLAWSPTGNAEDIIDNCVFLPEILHIGNDVFYAQSTEFQFDVCLVENSEAEIGSDWVNYTKKIIYNYEGINEISTTSDNISMKAIYLFSFDGEKREAYLQKVIETTSQASIIIPATVSYLENEYTVIQVLSNAFDIYSRIGELIFDKGSKLELIESNVFTTNNSLYLTQIQSYIENSTGDFSIVNDTIPNGLVISAGNNFKNTSWFTSKSSEIESGATEGLFITLGDYIIGYIECDNQKETSYTLDLTEDKVSNCTIIYDNAFKGANCNKVLFSNNIKYIYDSSFENSKLDYSTAETEDLFVLPENLKTIGRRAFFGCKFKKLVFPASLTSVEEGAFMQSSSQTDSIGLLDYVEFKNGCALKGVPFNVQTEISVTTTYGRSNMNATLKTLILPPTMSYIASTSFSQFRTLAQITNLYLGNFERNSEGGYLVENYKLYKDSDGNVTFDSEGNNLYTNDDGEQIYCYKFYHDIAKNIERYKDAYLETTEQYSFCPIGDISAEEPGYHENIDLSNILDYSDFESNISGETFKLEPLTRANILMICAGYCGNIKSDNVYVIRLKQEVYKKLTSIDIGIILKSRSINFDVIV